MKKFLELLALTMLTVSCSSVGPIETQLSPEIDYQKDLTMRVRAWDNNRWGPYKTIEGMGVVESAKGYKIRVEPPGKADMITVLSCHREWKTPNPKHKGGWFSKKYYEFEIWPTEEHEALKTCSFDAGVYEKTRGRHAWGLLVIDSEREKLAATVKCNGKTSTFGGTSVCQAKKGLIQSIHFDRKVYATETAGCILKKPEDGRNWVYQMTEGECVVYFVDVKNADNIHKAVLFGYDVIPIRGVE